MKHCQRGVSPMVATILLVAITVILASVLYILVAGLGSGSTDPRPISLEITLEGSSVQTPGGGTWANFSLNPSQPLTTSYFGFALVTSGGDYLTVGSGSCTAGTQSCSPGVGWIAFLYAPQGAVLSVWNSTGWSGNSTLTILSSMTLGLVAGPALHVAGSGDFLKVVSRAEPTVVGQSQPL